MNAINPKAQTNGDAHRSLVMHCGCGKRLKLPTKIIGRPGRCPGCGHLLTPCGRPDDSADPTGDAPYTSYLQVLQGPARQGDYFMLAGADDLTMGKRGDCDIVLPGNQVSRSHCRMVPTRVGWSIVDDRSTNGVRVNRSRAGSTLLKNGDEIVIGDFLLRFVTPRKPPVIEEVAEFDDADVVGESDGSDDVHDLDDLEAIDEPEIIELTAEDEVDPGDDAYELDIPAPPPLAQEQATIVTPNQPSRAASFVAGMANVVDVAAASESVAAAAVPTQPCPSCHRELQATSTVCVQCGIRIGSGRPLVTSHAIDREEMKDKARKYVWPISWVIPFGLFPAASEAMTSRRPWAVWGITIVIVLISIGFWVISSEHSGKHLMLWAGNQTPHPQYLHLLYTLTDRGDQNAYLRQARHFAKLKDDGEKLPVSTAIIAELDPAMAGRPFATSSFDDDVIIAAHESLSPQERCTSPFRVYQLLTHAFLHGGIMHLAGNMLFFLVFASRVNGQIGNIMTVLLYPVLAIIAAVAHLLISQNTAMTPMLGASGAVMGYVGVYFVLFPLERVHMLIWLRIILFLFRLLFNVFRVRGFVLVGIYVFMDALNQWLSGGSGGVAHMAHLGGFAGGAMLAILMMVSRLTYSGSNIVSVALGRLVWPILGSPAERLPQASWSLDELVFKKKVKPVAAPPVPLG